MPKTSPLSEISGFGNLVNYYEENKDIDWSKWLSFDTLFEKSGKQGLVGLFNTHNKEEGGYNKKIVFKISKYINYLVHHEYSVMKGLNDISPYCPHFCKTIGTVLCKVDPKFRTAGNPFQISSKYPIEKEVLLTEYIDNSCKFYNYIRSSKIKDNVIFSSIKQVLMAIAIAQRKKQFTHYDLHSFNIMMKKCNKDVVYLYVLDEDNQFCVPTFGHYPVIIDFGFSYIKDFEDNPCWPSMGHTDVGFMSDRFDWVADPKLFLVTVAKEMMTKRKSRKSRKFKNIVKNIFGNLKIDWDSGWDTDNKKSASTYVIDMLEGYSSKSSLFEKYDHYCIDIIQTLIILPFEEQKYDDIDHSYQAFLKEFSKIEDQIGNDFYNLYILKGIVDFAREVRSDYTCKNTREKAVKWFQQSTYERINCVSNFCVPKNIHFEKMLCSLLCLSKNIEGILYDVIETRMRKKEKSYSKLPVQSIEQIHGILDVNIPDKYEYNENTTIFIMNCVGEECDKIQLNKEQCDEVNNMNTLFKGSFIYNIYDNK